jgi:hypothetical protein
MFQVQGSKVQGSKVPGSGFKGSGFKVQRLMDKLGGTFRSILLTDGILGREVFNFLLVALIRWRFRRAVI